MNTRELDAKIAEKVFGWNWYPVKFNREQSVLAPSENAASAVGLGESLTKLVPNYSADIAAAWTVIEKMRCRLDLIKVDDGWMVGYFDGYTDDEGRVEGRMKEFVIAATAPVAICLAALKAVGVESPEGITQ